MNDLCTEVGIRCLNKYGEQLCGDHVEIENQGDGSTILVLADGLGSGVKASILSTLTAKIISTMMSQGLSLEECVATMAATLPICSVRKLAYSTFSILHIAHEETAEIISYDNPAVILLRDGKSVPYQTDTLTIDGKEIIRAHISIRDGDLFAILSDGAIHAGAGLSYNLGWKHEDIVTFLENLFFSEFTAKTLATILLDECNRLYENKPSDDTTVCMVKIRKREPMNLMIGPPASREDCTKMMSLFFAKQGKHLVCGGTTSAIAAEYLGKPVISTLDFPDPNIPPIARIDGVDLVTEGVITISKVLTYAQDYLADNKTYEQWSFKKDGASQIARLLFEEATDINFYVGKAVNPAHQNPELPIHFNVKMQLVDQLANCLKNMGKNIKVSYF